MMFFNKAYFTMLDGIIAYIFEDLVNIVYYPFVHTYAIVYGMLHVDW